VRLLPVFEAWRALPPEERESRTARAETLWNSMREAGEPYWSELYEGARYQACLWLDAIDNEQRGQDERTYRCAVCFDRGFVPQGRGVWFCTCDLGTLGEAGYWRRTRTPQDRGRRTHSVIGQRQWEEYAERHPQRANQIRAAIAEMVKREQATEGGDA